MWFITASNITLLRTMDAALTQHFFDNNCTYALASPSTAAGIPGWSSIPTATFTSYADFQTAINKKSIAPTVKAVTYDDESWSSTPANEQANPALYTQMFSSLAHANGYLFISTPGTDLVSVMPGYNSKNTEQQEFLRLGVATFSAKVADIFEIQGQSQEYVASQYVSYIASVAAQAKQASPSVVLMAGITTNEKNGNVPTADELYQAVIQTGGLVSGYWLNIPETGPPCSSCTVTEPQIAVDFLRELEAHPLNSPPFRRKRP
jgi:hypothetical protein